MKKLILIPTCLLLISFYGCERNNEIDYIVSINSTFTIVLPSNPSTGYSWYWQEKRIGVVDSLKTEYYNEEGIGKEGKEIWTFIARKKGKEKLVFAYKRIHETTYESKKEFFVKVK